MRGLQVCLPRHPHPRPDEAVNRVMDLFHLHGQPEGCDALSGGQELQPSPPASPQLPAVPTLRPNSPRQPAATDCGSKPLACPLPRPPHAATSPAWPPWEDIWPILYLLALFATLVLTVCFYSYLEKNPPVQPNHPNHHNHLNHLDLLELRKAWSWT